MDNSEEFRCISLCTGYAGIELGLKRVVPALRTVCYVEVEAFAAANLVAKIEQGLLAPAPVWTDIKTFDGRPFYKRVHIITAGYPCQGESLAGKRLGKSDPRWLWPYIERIIQAVRSVWFFGENVSGHLTLGFPTVYRSLRNMGYTVEAGLFTAEEIGTPHKRERLFILANSRNRGFCRSTLLRQQQGGTETIGTSKDRWPALPGQPQYEWEEPRVVADTSKTSIQQTPTAGADKERRTTTSSTSRQGQAQSRLGGAVDGTSCRVDRLRLLGNGVVPQQAEKAFRGLMKFFEANR